MNTYIKVNILLSLLIWGLISCEKEMIDYSGVDGVYFQMQPKTLTEFGDPELWPYSDVTEIPFARTVVDDTTIMLKVKLMGSLVAYDRKFKVEVVDTATTAVAGREYELNGDIFIMEANKEVCLIPIKFFRTEELSEGDLKLQVKLSPTSDLNVALKYWHSLGQQAKNDTARVDIHTFKISNIFSKPTIWNDFVAGPFSVAKIQLMMKLFDLEPKDFDKENMSLNRFRSLIIALKLYLIDRENEGNPVYETDLKGNIVYEKDAAGNFVLDDKGEKIPVKMTVGNVI